MAKPEGDGESLSTVYPSSLQCYVEDILRSSELSSKLSSELSSNLSDHYKKMNNEWARYISFRTFPLSSSVQPIKLAKAGFFYTGQGEETSCFSCGLRYKNWKSDESPLDVHKRLSPDCMFINGNGFCNAHKNGYANGACMSSSDSDTTTTNSQCLENGKRSEEQFELSFTKGISEVRNSDNAQGQISPTNTTDRLGVETNISLAERQIKSPDGIQGREPEYSSTTTPNVKTRETDQTSILEPTKQKATKQNIQHFEINFEKSKYPHYSVLTVRLESFRGWLSHHTQKPADLAAAGFYYVGRYFAQGKDANELYTLSHLHAVRRYQLNVLTSTLDSVGDCVRCFFCEGGLRSWEQGDDPWIEHAQWYPDCDFLKQKKGDDFVLRQLAGINLRSEELFNIEPHLIETSEVRFADQVFNIKSKTSVVEADSKDLMDLPAVQSVLSIGYSIEMVRQAKQILQSRKGKSVISGNSLMEVIFEIEEAESIKQTIELDASNDTKQKLDKMMRADDRIKVGNETNDNCVTLQDSIISIDEEKNNESSKGSMSPEELDSLLEQNRELKDKMTCKICMDREACIVFLPCCHMMACAQCAPALRKCPVCRQVVKGTVRAYVS